MEKSAQTGVKKKPVIGITIGDLNGIGPEIIIKTLADNRLFKQITPVIYSSTKVLSYYRKMLEMDAVNHHVVDQHFNLHFKKINIRSCWEETAEISPGQITTDGGKYAFLSLEAACNDLKEGKIDAIVTAPINKANIQSENFDFIGHTEYLGHQFLEEGKESLMFLVSDDLRVGVVTSHIPLADVKNQLTKKKIIAKIGAMNKSLKQDFDIIKPKIAVLGVNPHAGEEGLIGNEEIEVITPAITEAKKKGILVFGPFPADGFFGKMEFKKFDGVLAMYHDQGLIPFKTLAFDEGVNFTAGLPVVRTSPDHGTAYSIAGKNEASHTSMLKAIYLAVDVVKNRNS